MSVKFLSYNLLSFDISKIVKKYKNDITKNYIHNIIPYIVIINVQPTKSYKHSLSQFNSWRVSDLVNFPTLLVFLHYYITDNKNEKYSLKMRP